ncbi:hypothetical protein [Psychrobacter sp. I-STPA10]|uniref:hypothetical protein n=1 Tax=Psychrobacter sp. I-STPA10 TaxID=2585769 RepID=UPI001E49E690|nr:hypothetical protein [Psychrobacter sp. I-STPA10]
MYSIMVAFKETKSLEFIIGSAMSLSFIYQPAKTLKLDVILMIDEDKYITKISDIDSFKKEIYQLYDFWINPDFKINNLRPMEIFIKELEVFCIKVNSIPSNEIDYITLF